MPSTAIWYMMDNSGAIVIFISMTPLSQRVIKAKTKLPHFAVVLFKSIFLCGSHHIFDQITLLLFPCVKLMIYHYCFR